MNRPDELRVALASVRSGSSQPFELIVSDDGDGTARVVAEMYDAIYIQGPRRGLGANRNAAISMATGDLVSFIDDDVVVPADFVQRASASDARYVTTGWELNFSSDPARKVTPHNASFLGFQKVVPLKEYRSIVINATVFPAALFDRASFNANVKYGYEEIDMARQAVALGWKIRYDDSIWVEHHPSQANRGLYNAALSVSRLYLTHKAYSEYERARIKPKAFMFLAGLHQIAHALRSGQSLSAAIATLREVRRLRAIDRLDGVS